MITQIDRSWEMGDGSSEMGDGRDIGNPKSKTCSERSRSIQNPKSNRNSTQAQDKCLSPFHHRTIGIASMSAETTIKIISD
jgi:hypothetical protein